MKLIKLYTLLIALMAATSALACETPKFDPNAYVAEQHKFVLREVRMTPDEAKKFFALYDEMRTKLRKVFDRMRGDRRKKPTSDAECRAIITKRDNDGLELKKIEQQYHQKMLKVLPAKKVLDALIAADKFDKQKFREMNTKQCKNKDCKKDAP